MRRLSLMTVLLASVWENYMGVVYYERGFWRIS
jgi:hypothetical protein